MRPPEIFLYVLFPILIAIGIALGMDATGPSEFNYARGALAFAAVIAFGLTMWWFYQTEFTVAAGIMVFFTTGCIGIALLGGLKWLDLKENVYCFVMANFYDLHAPPPYTLSANSVGPYPTLRASLSIRNVNDSTLTPPNQQLNYQIGDIDPDITQGLAIPPVGAGTYQITIHTHTGNFVEFLTIKWDGKQASQEWKVNRVTIRGNQVVLTPMQ